MVPIVLEIPSDILTPVSTFLKLRQAGYQNAFLLESADGGEQIGRYSYLGINSFASLKSCSDKLLFSEKNKSPQIISKFNLKSIEEIINSYRSPKMEKLPDFVGGVIGNLDYEFVEKLEKLSPREESLNSNAVNLMFFKDIIVFDRLKNKIFIVSHVDSNENIDDSFEKAIGQIEKNIGLIRARSEDQHINFPLNNAESIEKNYTHMLGKDVFCAGVKKIKRHIKAGDIFQAVLSERFTTNFSGDPFLIYRSLRAVNPSPYQFFVDYGNGECLLGASPEMLVKSNSRTIQTSPIAGTRPRGDSNREDKKYETELLRSVKEKAEHLMLVDLGRNDLGRESVPGSVQVKSFMEVQRFSHVMHLVSLVEGKLKKSSSPLRALASCFPAGTLSGAPKIKAMNIISSIEKEKRGPYGGAVISYGFSGKLNSCITIRSVYIKSEKAHFQAGAGVVADSNPEKEYQEVLNKAKAVKKALEYAKTISADSERTI
jgi:anthranilate synthase component 1